MAAEVMRTARPAVRDVWDDIIICDYLGENAG